MRTQSKVIQSVTISMVILVLKCHQSCHTIEKKGYGVSIHPWHKCHTIEKKGYGVSIHPWHKCHTIEKKGYGVSIHPWHRISMFTAKSQKSKGIYHRK